MPNTTQGGRWAGDDQSREQDRRGGVPQLFGIDFDEFTRRQAPVKLRLALARFAETVNTTVLQFADESHPLYHKHRDRLVRAVRDAWQLTGPIWRSGGGR